MSAPKIYIHSLTGADGPGIVSQALDRLRPHLPISLPLYRRLQFGRFFDATVLLTNLPDLSSPSEENQSSPWIIAFADRTCRPETEVWLFSSWEATSGVSSSGNSASAPEETDKQQQQQDTVILAFAQTLATLPLPPSIHADVIPSLNTPSRDAADETKDSAGLTRTSYAGHSADPNVMLCGAVHRASVPALQRSGLVTERFKVGLVDNHTYVFDVDRLPPVPPTLPEAGGISLRWGRLTAAHFPIVRARTQIPRLDRTLGAMANVAVFEEGTGRPVAWAFVGLDASLTSLHVEPEWRGRGLAKAVTRRLFEEEMETFWEEGAKRLAHGYVQVDNEASCRVCESLGGKSGWEVVWVRLDLGVLRS